LCVLRAVLTVAVLVAVLVLPARAGETPASRGAALFSRKCALCHTIGQGVLIGPDLSVEVSKGKSDVEAFVTSMQKNVGPLQADEIGELVQFLQQANAAAMLQHAVQASGGAVQPAPAGQSVAPFNPSGQGSQSIIGSARAGEKLFSGSRALINGGVACVSCHSAGMPGGSMGPDLSGVSGRLSKQDPLFYCQGNAVPLMKGVYARHAIVQDEAADLSAYVASVPASRASRTWSALADYSTITGVILSVLIVLGYVRCNRCALFVDAKAAEVQEDSSRA
jgi:cytochrome c2